MKISRISSGLLPVSSLFLLAGSALAGNVHHSQLTIGQFASNISSGGVSITADAAPRAFKAKTVNSVTGVGISGGAVDGEIDGDESISFSFSKPVRITSFSVAHLYAKPHFGDNPDEVATVDVGFASYDLAVTSTTTALWGGFGSVLNDSVASEAGGGAWTVFGSDLFGGLVTDITFRSGNPGSQGKYSDFTFVQLGFEVIPLPSAAGLALVGLGAAASLRRRLR